MSKPAPGRRGLAAAVGAVGVVFGNLGVAPLYALRESFGSVGPAPDPQNIVGVVSLLLWSLTLIVGIKYAVLVLQADNRGEGGILALVSLVLSSFSKRVGRRVALVAMVGLIGAALLFAETLLTPALTVLSAVEGLAAVAPGCVPGIVPLVLFILTLIFLVQAGGTRKLAALTGPLMAVWFLVLAVLGGIAVVRAPGIVGALNPWAAVEFAAAHGFQTLTVFGSVFLAVTGAEVLSTSLGSFGSRPIRRVWFVLVYPALVLNYLGQGASVLAGGETGTLFFQLAPEWLRLPLVGLATAAAVAATQAVITAAFSLARQCIQLDYWPRMKVRHTSDRAIGQVYVPFINGALFVGTAALVLGFRSSHALAGAYGVATSAGMLLTGILVLSLSLRRATRFWPFAALLGAVFLLVDLTFFAANLGKLATGGWIAGLVACCLFVLMKTWRDGRAVLRQSVEATTLSLEDFTGGLGHSPPPRVHRTAVFLAGNPRGVPTALLHNLKHNRIMHDPTLIVSVQTAEQPRVPAERRAEVRDWGGGIWTIVFHFGYSELPDVPQALAALQVPGLDVQPEATTYFLGRESLVIAPAKRTMLPWRKRLFRFMSHNASPATSFFRLPVDQVVEISAQTEL